MVNVFINTYPTKIFNRNCELCLNNSLKYLQAV